MQTYKRYCPDVFILVYSYLNYSDSIVIVRDIIAIEDSISSFHYNERVSPGNIMYYMCINNNFLPKGTEIMN